MRTFRLVREDDITGVSGTGVVCEGIEFSDGTAVIHWIVGAYRTTTVHPDGVGSVVHIHGHGGATRLVFESPSGAVAAFPNVPVGSEPRAEVSYPETVGEMLARERNSRAEAV
jgi:hypothetical protein